MCERDIGVGPFVYTLTTERGTQTSPPTPNRSYTFGEHGAGNGIKLGETVTVNVVDTKIDQRFLPLHRCL